MNLKNKLDEIYQRKERLLEGSIWEAKERVHTYVVCLGVIHKN